MTTAEYREMQRERQGAAAAKHDIEHRSLGWARENYQIHLSYRVFSGFARGYLAAINEAQEARNAAQ